MANQLITTHRIAQLTSSTHPVVMAPPQVTNMSVLQSTTQRTTRQTAQQPSQYVFDEDENTYVDDEAMEEEPDESQGTSVETLMSKMVNDVGPPQTHCHTERID